MTKFSKKEDWLETKRKLIFLTDHSELIHNPIFHYQNWEPFFSDLKSTETIKKQIPNLLTLSRGIAPIVISPLLWRKKLVLVGSLTGAFALTDLFDGIMARKYDAQSPLGKSLDQVCDKIFSLGLGIPLAHSEKALVKNLLLECGISMINFTSNMKGNNDTSLLIGKIKMFPWFATMIVAALELRYPNLKNKTQILSLITFILQCFVLFKYIDNDKQLEMQKRLTK